MYFRVQKIIFIFFFSLSKASVVTDVTSDLFSETSGDLLAAFGDFNADKQTDLFVIRNEGKQIAILLSNTKGKLYERQILLNVTDTGSYVASIIPGDYDGDLQMDFLVVFSTATGFKVAVYWSQQNDAEISIEKPTVIEDELQDQPLVLDWNADRLPDFLGESSGNLYVWIASPQRNFSKKLVNTTTALKKPHSNAFIDLDDDYTADLFLTKELEYEEWLNIGGTMTFNNTVSFPEYGLIGQTSFADFDQDSVPDILVPVCEKKSESGKCTGSKIVMYNKGRWSVILEDFKQDTTTWEFVSAADSRGSSIEQEQTFPITLRMGDFNMDGHPDALAILQTDGSTKQRAFLLINEACDESYCQDIGRKLVVQWSSQFSTVNGAVLATFYDIYDDGVLDILLVTISNDIAKLPQIRAYKNMFTSDACFVKVTVVSGLCNKECPNKREPYGGSNSPGVTIKYKTMTTKGEPQKSCATQLSQSAYYALQLPYTIFGLGQTPNFVDTLGVGMPQNTSLSLKKEWTQIIPNSQLVVIPYPEEQPYYWVLHLFATPSRTIYITGAVLIGTCGFVAGIVGILHLRDRREDKLEKQQESQKFHFDAM